jgi:DNA excision repair protein ERCC-4
MRSEPSDDDIVVIYDTREQLPLDLSPYRMVKGTLATGDYTLEGLEDVVCIERKSLDDFLSCVGNSRERFERELRRMLAYRVKAVFVEASLRDLEAGNWRSKIPPQTVISTYLGWTAWGIPIVLANNRESSQRLMKDLLRIEYARWHKRAYRIWKRHDQRLGTVKNV